MKNVGIMAAIRKIYDSGKITVEEVLEELVSQNIDHKETSVRTIVYKFRKKAGLSNKKPKKSNVETIIEPSM